LFETAAISFGKCVLLCVILSQTAVNSLHVLMGGNQQDGEC